MSLPSLYKYTTYKNGMSSIQNNLFKWSSIKSFNDPFEAKFFIENDLNTELRLNAITISMTDLKNDNFDRIALLKKYKNFGSQFVNCYSRLLSDLVKIQKEHINKNTPDYFFRLEECFQQHAKKEPLRKYFINQKSFSTTGYDIISNKYGVLCLSAAFNNHLMWGHYAEMHKGLMFEFEFNEHNTYPIFLLSLHKVKYEKYYPLMTFNDILGINPTIFPERYKQFFVKLVATKNIEWSYEEEYRSVLSSKYLGSEGLTYISKDCIKSITLGSRMEIEEERKIIQEARKNLPNAIIYKNTLAPQSYSFIRKQL